MFDFFFLNPKSATEEKCVLNERVNLRSNLVRDTSFGNVGFTGMHLFTARLFLRSRVLFTNMRVRI